MKFFQDSINSNWIEVNSCPLCGSKKIDLKGEISQNEYKFGNIEILFPDKISILQCMSCMIHFKSCIPSPSYISEIFESQSGKVWSEEYDFKPEADFVNSLIAERNFDLLDIGASNGAFLKSISHRGGRRSALDVVKDRELSKNIRGEFIKGFLDDPTLDWSRRPYDIVTIFDVIEHVYNPRHTFQNLSQFVKQNGYVVLETGNAQSRWAEKFGIHNWWYINLFEHHIFWDKNTLENIAKDYGFKITYYLNKKHKNIANLSFKNKSYNSLKNVLYSINPKIYIDVLSRLGKTTIQPFSPFIKDHMFVVLQKEEL